MCGIAGWIAGPDSALMEDTLSSMLQAIAHRGPDDEGKCYFRGASTGQHVFLGHRRLAIIDPEGAHQPMCDAAAGLALTFNGEIYNFRELREQLTRLGYRFARDSDTEVLLRAYQHWGCEVVHHLRGMFAFAIWDAPNERLFLARDRFGEKPLFLYESAAGRDRQAADGERRAIRSIPLRRDRFLEHRGPHEPPQFEGQDIFGGLRRRQLQRTPLRRRGGGPFRDPAPRNRGGVPRHHRAPAATGR